MKNSLRAETRLTSSASRPTRFLPAKVPKTLPSESDRDFQQLAELRMQEGALPAEAFANAEGGSLRPAETRFLSFARTPQAAAVK